MWPFDIASGKRVTRTEFRDLVIPRLRHRGLTDDDLRYVRAVLDADLNESGSDQGISEKEIEALAINLKHNAPPTFSSDNIAATLEELHKVL